MHDQVRTIRLYGRLGSTFGRVHRLAVGSAAEAVRALCTQVPGFERFLMQAKDNGMGFSVFLGRRNLVEDELDGPAGHDDIRIAPILLGAKNGGVFNIILGAVLIFAGAVAGLFQLYPLATALAGMGWGMIAGGVVQLLSPSPKGIGAQDRPDNKPSHAFNGPVNTQAQGNPVPYLFGGPMIVGSAVISAGIYAEDVYVPTGSAAGGGGGGSGGGGGGGSPPWHGQYQVLQ